MMTLRKLNVFYRTAQVLYWMALTLPMGFSVLYAQSRGLHISSIGLVTTVYTAAIVILEIPTGGLADRWGRRPTAITANLCLAASAVLLAMAHTVWHFAAGFLLMGVGRAMASGAIDAWYVEGLMTLSPENDVHRHLSVSRTFSRGSIAAAILLGGILADWIGSYAAVYTISAGLLAVSVLPIIPAKPAQSQSATARPSSPVPFCPSPSESQGATAQPETPQPAVTHPESEYSQPGSCQETSEQEGTTNPVWNALVTSWSMTTLRLMILTSAAIGMALIGVEIMWQPTLTAVSDIELPTTAYSTVMAVAFGAGAAGALLGGRLPVTRWGLVKTAAILALLTSVPLAGVAILVVVGSPSIALTITAAAGLVLFYVGLAGVDVVLQTLAAKHTPNAVRAGVMSVHSFSGYTGSMVTTGIIVPLLAESYSWTVWSILACGVLLAATAIRGMESPGSVEETHDAQTKQPVGAVGR